MRRRLCVAGVVGMLLILASGWALAKQGVVKTRDGQTYEGEITEKSGTIIINRNGIETRVTQNNVASLTYPEDFDKQFGERLAKLDKKDSAGRIKLAREAFDNGRYTLARDVLEEVLTIDPNNSDAAQMRETAMAQIRLERAKQNPPATAEARGPATMMAATTQAENDRRLLKPRDINRIRQIEMNLDKGTDKIAAADANIPIRFEHEVNRRYARDLAKRPAGQFLALSSLQQAAEIVQNGPPEMRDDIKIMRDPQSMFEYKRAVQPFVIQNCATSQCHGGQYGGRLELITPGSSEPAMYTNFYILQSLTKKAPEVGKVFSKNQLAAIDRMQPTRSLLLDYAIPKNLSEYDHPDVPNYHPPLRGVEDPIYRTMLNWISNMLRPDPPVNYGIEFRPGAATTGPATTGPATGEATTEPATTRPATSRPAVGRGVNRARMRG